MYTAPTTMYRDFALSPELFRWESQSTTSGRQPTRWAMARRTSSLRLADYISREGDRPMAITWRLRQAMPTEVYLGARAAVARPHAAIAGVNLRRR